MDMTISIRKDWVFTLLYEKSMNLYLYIPPHPANTLGVLIGLVSGKIIRIHSLCSYEDDINLRMKEFYARLLVCGYQHDLLIPDLTKGLTGARAFIKRESVQRCLSDQEKDTKGCVCFHLTYNPRQPTSKDLQLQGHQHLPHPTWECPL